MARIVTTDNTLTAPAWAGDFMNREHLVPGGARLDPAQFSDAESVAVVVGAAGAAGAATTVPVGALSGPIPSGTTLHFGTNKFATLSADAAAGATSLTVLAIPTALVSGDTAVYSAAGDVTRVPSGTVIGRTIAERTNGDGFGPAIDSDDEIFIVAFDVTDAAINPDVELYRPGSVVKENFLPDAPLGSALLAEVRDRYICTVGAA